ncbi:hypothetical protein [Novosphingobium sp. FKTRR1]|uniref:hypothetical protein n=1 Tax=Novosphingobium sp. FKTRR1 TaxID=2879118 RepID=UPI001CF0A5AC|nr:hypothetical protein [Novosphingobium sp. FKTRR1]
MNHPATRAMLDSGALSERDLAIAAAESLSLATADLLRFAREGEAEDGQAFSADIVASMADALATMCILEQTRACEVDDGDADALAQLAAALHKFSQDFGQ